MTDGVTSGEPMVVRGAVKPISTLARPLPSADLVTGDAVDKAHYERSDISVVPAAGVVGEAMVMLTLADAMLDTFGGNTIGDTRDALDRYVARISAAIEPPVAGGPRAAKAGPGAAVGGPRNRWALYRHRVPIWLDVRPEVLAQRLRRSPNVRPLIAGRDPMGTIRDLARERERFYSAANRLNGVAELASIVERTDELVGRSAGGATQTVLLRGRSLGGDLVIGEGIAGTVIAD